MVCCVFLEGIIQHNFWPVLTALGVMHTCHLLMQFREKLGVFVLMQQISLLTQTKWQNHCEVKMKWHRGLSQDFDGISINYAALL